MHCGCVVLISFTFTFFSFSCITMVISKQHFDCIMRSWVLLGTADKKTIYWTRQCQRSFQLWKSRLMLSLCPILIIERWKQNACCVFLTPIGITCCQGISVYRGYMGNVTWKIHQIWPHDSASNPVFFSFSKMLLAVAKYFQVSTCDIIQHSDDKSIYLVLWD